MLTYTQNIIAHCLWCTKEVVVVVGVMEHSEHLCPGGQISSVYSGVDKSPSCP